MEIAEEILVQPTKHSRLAEVDFNNLGFGNYVSDHMLVCNYANGHWDTPKITAFADLTLSPTALALHYGQTVFEGMKAFKLEDGRVNLFRINKHYDRFVKSLERMCMAVVPEELFIEGIHRLVEVDKNWIPSQQGSSLYIRPFVFASEPKFGVHVSNEYCFVIYTGPVSPTFSRPIALKVETEYVRAARGGTGFAKCGGNYGGAFLPTQKAREAGYDQVLWTDARENKYIEESGMMNAMFVIDGTLVTPPLSDSILDGITRDSLLAVAGDLGIAAEERRISIDEIEKAFRQNTISEAFGAGTAAVVAPIARININGVDHHLPDYKEDAIMFRLKNKLEAIRTGKDADKHGWNFLF